jgi:hypothetical protein
MIFYGNVEFFHECAWRFWKGFVMISNDFQQLQHPQEVARLTVQLWISIAAELTLIIGKHGFISLFERSLYLTQLTFPWLGIKYASHTDDAQFALLKTSLEGRDFSEADAGSNALLDTFSNLLAELIGKPLVTGILRSARDRQTSDIKFNEV